MKILDRKRFLLTPKETLFSYYSNADFTGLNIKTSDVNDMDSAFTFDCLVGAVENDSTGDFFDKCESMVGGGSMSMDFNYTGREGMLNNKQMFAVYEKGDVVALIGRLKKVIGTK